MADAAVERYVELKREISKLEKELDDLKDSIFQTVDTAGGEVTEEGYVLKTQKRPKYKYSDEYETKNKELKDLKERRSQKRNGGDRWLLRICYVEALRLEKVFRRKCSGGERDFSVSSIFAEHFFT